MEELRKFYSAQAVKHKEDMEQAVSHKVSGLQATSFYHSDGCYKGHCFEMYSRD